jgi:hypothetical protein
MVALLQSHKMLNSYRFVLDDRKMYKPKEEVHLKGFIRRFDREVSNFDI